MTTTFSTVIATRNRASILAASLPLHLKQSRLPEQIIIVDSSNDTKPNSNLVESLNRGSQVPIVHITSVAGSSIQRNIGMEQVDSDVIFFPDDDSIVYPDTLAQMMRIYDRDKDGYIGGVTTSTAIAPPEGALHGGIIEVARERKPSRARSYAHQLRHVLEALAFPNPIEIATSRLCERLPAPEAWLDSENAIRIPWITGFRMSFRTESIRRVQFNTILGRYSMYEDADACMQILRGGQSLVAARNAMIYHHVSPEKRLNSRQFGAIRILNSAYVTMRSGVVDRKLKSKMLRHEWFKMQYIRADRKGKYGGDQYLGARDARRVLPELLASSPEPLRVCRRLQLLSKVEHHEQDHEQIFPRSARACCAPGSRQ